MIRPQLGRAAGLVAAAAVFAGLGGGCGRAEPGHRQCSRKQEADAAALAGLPILRAHPASARADGAFSGCGVDDSGDPVATHAGRRYRGGPGEAETRSFYWAALERDGWRSASTVIPPAVAPSLAFQRGVSCLVKQFRGGRVRFDLRIEPGAYVVQVSAGGCADGE